jgi:hypothetical protein
LQKGNDTSPIRSREDLEVEVPFVRKRQRGELLLTERFLPGIGGFCGMGDPLRSGETLFFLMSGDPIPHLPIPDP